MDLRFTPEEEAFRADVKAFLADNLSAEVVRKGRNSEGLTKQDMEDWHAALNARGWLAVTWPRNTVVLAGLR